MTRDQINRLTQLALETQDSVLLERAAYLLHELGHHNSIPRYHHNSIPRYMRTNYDTGEREFSDTADFKEITKRTRLVDEFSSIYGIHSVNLQTNLTPYLQIVNQTLLDAAQAVRIMKKQQDKK